MSISNYPENSLGTDHLPFCDHCGQFVTPRVVASTETIGGVILPAHPQLIAANSKTIYKKMCPICGNQVSSEQDRRNEREQDNRIFYCWMIAIISIIIMMVYAATHAPK